MTMAAHFSAMADYNRWANDRLFADVAALPEAASTQDVRIYFRSALGTLVHLLNSDRAWTFLLQGGKLVDMQLPPLPADMDELRAGRTVQDDFFVEWLGDKDQAWLDQPFVFTSGLGSLAGRTYRGTHATTLTHLFNHQTHHRGQVHAALTILGVAEPRPLDMLVMGFAEQ